MVLKRHRVLWAKAHLKWTVSKLKNGLWSDESKCEIPVGNHGCCVLRAEEEEGLAACHQCSFKKKNNNNLLHLYNAFLGTQSTLHRRGGRGSPQSPPMSSIHLDDATAAVLHQNAHHRPAYLWRGDRVMKPISVWGWLGGHDGQRPMGKFG